MSVLLKKEREKQKEEHRKWAAHMLALRKEREAKEAEYRKAQRELFISEIRLLHFRLKEFPHVTREYLEAWR